MPAMPTLDLTQTREIDFQGKVYRVRGSSVVVVATRARDGVQYEQALTIGSGRMRDRILRIARLRDEHERRYEHKGFEP